MEENKVWQILSTLFLVGSVIALGQLLASEEKLTWRIVVGRMLSSGGLAVGAGAALQLWPEIPLLALIGLSAILASLGTSVLEKLFNKFLGGN